MKGKSKTIKKEKNNKKNDKNNLKLKKINKRSKTNGGKIIQDNLSSKKTNKSNSIIKLNKNKKSNLNILETNKSNKKNSKEKIKDIYDDYELNSFSYVKALKYDKRTYCQYYIFLIKTKHPILFSFCPFKDYNSIIIKLSIFILFFSVNYVINQAFFNESTIHKIYKDNGTYNFGYLIPQILYSFIISHTFFILIKYFFLSERFLLEIKKGKGINDISDKIYKGKKCLVIKYICFYVGGSLILIFFWYYISSFGAVYQNTQVYLIKNTLISFAFTLIYPFFINLLPAILRNCSLNDEKRDNECLFKISKFIQIL